jgi:MFS superfamily sulfate permease-like transporter
MALDDFTIIVALSVVSAIAISACVALLLLMRRRTKKVPKELAKPEVDPLIAPALIAGPLRIGKSVQPYEAVKAKDELRTLDLEREILGEAIRRLYEAHAEGKITEQEREKLASSYKQRMMSVKESMSRDESIVALHELEGMQEDLMKLFKERFGELSGKVDELRSHIDIKAIKEVRIQMPKQHTPVVPDQMEQDEEDEESTRTKERPKKQRKSSSEKQKTEAEQRIDQIRSQIDEVMNKLGQMEMES